MAVEYYPQSHPIKARIAAVRSNGKPGVWTDGLRPWLVQIMDERNPGFHAFHPAGPGEIWTFYDDMAVDTSWDGFKQVIDHQQQAKKRRRRKRP